MVRNLLCPQCASEGEYKLHPEDRACGWSERRVTLNAKRPADLHIEVTGGGESKRIEVPHLVCDACNARIDDGTPALAVTHWRSEGEPEQWENEYGTITAIEK